MTEFDVKIVRPFPQIIGELYHRPYLVIDTAHTKITSIGSSHDCVAKTQCI